jgi:hypothetical protein
MLVHEPELRVSIHVDLSSAVQDKIQDNNMTSRQGDAGTEIPLPTLPVVRWSAPAHAVIRRMRDPS